MPACRQRSRGRFAGAFGGLFATIAALALGVACESAPCRGNSCPDACNGVDCDDLASPGPQTPGRFTPCNTNAGCDEASGFTCVEGLCRHACDSHFDCGGVGVCETLGTSGTFCTLANPKTEPGGYYSHCPNGQCARDFSCIGAGVGDTESYCTKDCTGDAECPTGFYCDVDPGGEEERKVCVPKGFCTECESDTDCLSLPEGICARDASGERRCTQRCDASPGSCPWGAATTCFVSDDELGVPTCQHRFGACRGEGLGCHPCQRDQDCPSGYCLISSYTGERWCIDQASPCSCEGLTRSSQSFCTGPNDCAASPGGLPMVCYDPGTAGGGVCVGVNLPASAQLSCWR